MNVRKELYKVSRHVFMKLKEPVRSEDNFKLKYKALKSGSFAIEENKLYAEGYVDEVYNSMATVLIVCEASGKVMFNGHINKIDNKLF